MRQAKKLSKRAVWLLQGPSGGVEAGMFGAALVMTFKLTRICRKITITQNKKKI